MDQTRPAASRRIHRVDDRETQLRLRRARRARSGPVSVARVDELVERTHPRVSYAVGRPSGGAVTRNRIRRRLRSAMAELSPRLLGSAWLVGAGPAAAEIDYPSLKNHCGNALAALGR